MEGSHKRQFPDFRVCMCRCVCALVSLFPLSEGFCNSVEVTPARPHIFVVVLTQVARLRNERNGELIIFVFA